MGWGEKAIEIRSVEKGLLDGVFMHKRANKLKFLCERNDKGEVYMFDQIVYRFLLFSIFRISSIIDQCPSLLHVTSTASANQSVLMISAKLTVPI